MRVPTLILGAALATCAISPTYAQDHQLTWGEALARSTIGAGISYLTSTASGSELAGGVAGGATRANSGQLGGNLGAQALINGTSTAVALGIAGASGPAVVTAGGVYAARTVVNGAVNAAVDFIAPGADGPGKTFAKAGLTALGWAGIASFAGASAPAAAGAGVLTVVSGRILNWAFNPPPTYGNGLIGPAWVPPNVPTPYSEPTPVNQSTLPSDMPPTQTPPPTPTPNPTDSATLSSPSDFTTTTANLAPSNDSSPANAPGPSGGAPAPLPPMTFGGLGSPSTSSAQSGNLPADWCVVERTVTVIPGQTTKNYSAVRCDDAPGLGADWKVVDKGLTFAQANQIRDGFNGAPGNLPRVWCVMRNGAQKTVIRCDNTAGAGPGWILIATNLTLPTANQAAFGDPSPSPLPPPAPLPPVTVVNAPPSPPPVTPLPPTTINPQTPATVPSSTGTPQSGSACANHGPGFSGYGCTYMAYGNGASQTSSEKMVVCVPPSGNWSQAYCTVDSFRMDHVTDPNHPDSRDTCNPYAPTVLFHDPQSFEAWCKSQSMGQWLDPEPAPIQHADVLPVAPLPPVTPSVHSFIDVVTIPNGLTPRHGKKHIDLGGHHKPRVHSPAPARIHTRVAKVHRSGGHGWHPSARRGRHH